MNCPYADCGAPINPTAQFCPICGRSVKAREAAGTELHQKAGLDSTSAGTKVAVEPQPRTAAIKLERRYGALRSVAGLYKVVAVIVLILAGIAALFTYNTLGRAGGLFGRSSEQELLAVLWAGSVFMVGFVIFLILYAAGEAIQVIIAIEENTRATRTLLEQSD